MQNQGTPIGRVAFVYRGAYNTQAEKYTRYDVVLVEGEGLYHCLKDWEPKKHGEWATFKATDVCTDPKNEIKMRNSEGEAIYSWALFLPMTDVYKFLKDHLKSDKTIDITFFDEFSPTPVNPGDTNYHDIKFNVNPSALQMPDCTVTVNTWSSKSWNAGDELGGKSVIEVIKTLLCPYVSWKKYDDKNTEYKAYASGGSYCTKDYTLGTTKHTSTIKAMSGSEPISAKAYLGSTVLLDWTKQTLKTDEVASWSVSIQVPAKSTTYTAAVKDDVDSTGKNGGVEKTVDFSISIFDPFYTFMCTNDSDITDTYIDSLGSTAYALSKSTALSFSGKDAKSSPLVVKNATKDIWMVFAWPAKYSITIDKAQVISGSNDQPFNDPTVSVKTTSGGKYKYMAAKLAKPQENYHIKQANITGNTKVS